MPPTIDELLIHLGKQTGITPSLFMKDLAIDELNEIRATLHLDLQRALEKLGGLEVEKLYMQAMKDYYLKNEHGGGD